MPWSARFDEPIELPKGRKLVTLKDAAAYIMKLPAAEHSAPEWQSASSMRTVRIIIGESVSWFAIDRPGVNLV